MLRTNHQDQILAVWILAAQLPKSDLTFAKAFWSLKTAFSKAPEGHHPRGTTLREALRGNLSLRGLCRRFCGGPRDFPKFFGGSGPMLVTLGHCCQQVLNPTPLNPAPATCHKRKRKLRCSFRNAALQKLHCNIRFSAVRKSFGPKAALQQTKNCTATSKKLRCRKVALSCRFPAGFKPPRLGTHVSDLLRGPGTVRTVFQEPQAEPSPPATTVLKQKNPFQRGTIGTEFRKARTARSVWESLNGGSQMGA